MNSALYSIFISMTLRMTVITAFVLIIKTAFKSRLSPKMHCLIWLIPFIQFVFCLLGIRIQTSSSIYNIAPEAVSYYTASPTSPSAPGTGFDPKNIAALIWILVAAAMMIWFLSMFFIYKHRAKKYPLITDSETIKYAQDIRHTLNIPSTEKIMLRLGDTAQTMAHLVMLPRGYSGEEIKQILLHELCHYRHRDYAKQWFALTVLCLNWFNPLIWIAFSVFRSDIEMMCDDRVLALTDSKKKYAITLVKSATMKNRFIPGAAAVHNGKNEVKARIQRIVSVKKIKPAWMIAAACLCVTVSCLCLTDAVSIAVENNVDITATPEPVAIIPTTAPADTSEENANEPKEQYASVSDNNYASYDEPQHVYTEPEEAPVAPDISEPSEPIAEAADDAPTIAEDNLGNKETYTLDDGRTVIVQYDGESIENGYIIN